MSWELDRFFHDTDGNRIGCDLDNCTFGSYVVDATRVAQVSVVTTSAACTACDFTGDIIDVFRKPESSRHVPGAPDSYLTASRLVLTMSPDGIRMLSGLRSINPGLVEVIEQKE